MRAVFDLDPVVLPAAPIGAIAAFGNEPLEAHAAGGAKQVSTDLARLEWRYEYAIGPAAQRPRQVGLAQAQWQRPQVLAAEREGIEGLELHLVVVPARVQRVEDPTRRRRRAQRPRRR